MRIFKLDSTLRVVARYSKGTAPHWELRIGGNDTAVTVKVREKAVKKLFQLDDQELIMHRGNRKDGL